MARGSCSCMKGLCSAKEKEAKIISWKWEKESSLWGTQTSRFSGLGNDLGWTFLAAEAKKEMPWATWCLPFLARNLRIRWLHLLSGWGWKGRDGHSRNQREQSVTTWMMTTVSIITRKARGRFHFSSVSWTLMALFNRVTSSLWPGCDLCWGLIPKILWFWDSHLTPWSNQCRLVVSWDSYLVGWVIEVIWRERAREPFFGFLICKVEMTLLVSWSGWQQTGRQHMWPCRGASLRYRQGSQGFQHPAFVGRQETTHKLRGGGCWKKGEGPWEERPTAMLINPFYFDIAYLKIKWKPRSLSVVNK